MAKIIIKDLDDSKELDRLAMTKISGGFNPQLEPPAYNQFVVKTRVQKNRFGLSRKRYRKNTNPISSTMSAKGIIIVDV